MSIQDSDMRGRLAFIAVAISVTLAAAAPADALTADQVLAADQIRQVDREAADYIKAGKSAGMVVAVAVKGRPAFVRAYGFANLELGVPTTPGSVFRAGSITKQFTATAVLLLAERGKLQTYDKLSKYFPDFPRGDEVSLADLLDHTSGIHNYTETPDVLADARRAWTTASLVDHIKAQPRLYDFDPGTGWRYSNSNYVLLGAIIEKVSGRPLGDFISQNLFQPLGMTASAYDRDEDVVPGRAYGYDRVPGHGFSVAPFMSASYTGGAGSLRTTAGDLLVWERALFAGKVVSRAHLAEMTTPARLRSGELASTHRVEPPGRTAPTPPPDYDYGYGWYIAHPQGHLEFYHGGDVFGYSADVGHFPGSDLTFVILTNTSQAARDFVRQIRPILAK